MNDICTTIIRKQGEGDIHGGNITLNNYLVITLQEITDYLQGKLYNHIHCLKAGVPKKKTNPACFFLLMIVF